MAFGGRENNIIEKKIVTRKTESSRKNRDESAKKARANYINKISKKNTPEKNSFVKKSNLSKNNTKKKLSPIKPTSSSVDNKKDLIKKPPQRKLSPVKPSFSSVDNKKDQVNKTPKKKNNRTKAELKDIVLEPIDTSSPARYFISEKRMVRSAYTQARQNNLS